MKDCKFFKNEVFVRKYKDYRKKSLYNKDVNKEVGIERYYKLKFIIALALAFGGLYLVSPLGIKNNLTNLVCLNNVYESVENNISKKYLTNQSFDISNINLNGCSFAYIQSEKDMFDSINNLGSSNIDIEDAEIISDAISKILTQSRIFVGFLYFSIFIILTFSIYILKVTYVHNKNTVKI